MVSKDGRFYLRLSDDERRMFDEVTEALGIAGNNVSAAVRFLVREKHRELFGVTPMKRSAKRTRGNN